MSILIGCCLFLISGSAYGAYHLNTQRSTNDDSYTQDQRPAETKPKTKKKLAPKQPTTTPQTDNTQQPVQQTPSVNCNAIIAEQKGYAEQINNTWYDQYKSEKAYILNPQAEYKDYSSSAKQNLIDGAYNNYGIRNIQVNGNFQENVISVHCRTSIKIPLKPR